MRFYSFEKHWSRPLPYPQNGTYLQKNNFTSNQNKNKNTINNIIINIIINNIFFTFQGGESIDFTWSRYKVNKKILKIKSAELEDTGVFGCKGINGFGSDAVRLELIIVGKENDVMRIRDNTRVAIWPFETVYQNWNVTTPVLAAKLKTFYIFCKFGICLF